MLADDRIVLEHVFLNDFLLYDADRIICGMQTDFGVIEIQQM